jgi:hypothetical protein
MPRLHALPELYGGFPTVAASEKSGEVGELSRAFALSPKGLDEFAIRRKQLERIGSVVTDHDVAVRQPGCPDHAREHLRCVVHVRTDYQGRLCEVNRPCAPLHTGKKRYCNRKHGCLTLSGKRCAIIVPFATTGLLSLADVASFDRSGAGGIA